ncbi:MAG: hypothetical protein WDA16_06230, partial [Candidatus Thermoplasmatota archaeon]
HARSTPSSARAARFKPQALLVGGGNTMLRAAPLAIAFLLAASLTIIATPISEASTCNPAYPEVCAAMDLVVGTGNRVCERAVHERCTVLG